MTPRIPGIATAAPVALGTLVPATTLVGLVTLIAVVAVVALPGCGAGTDGDAVVERWTVGDTTVVRTVSGSEWGTPRHLELDFAIGEMEGEEAYMFGDIVAIRPLTDGSVLVLDRQPPVVRHYDADGMHLRDIGGAGEGPGEFLGPADLAVLADGGVTVLDLRGRRIAWFHPDGTPAETRSVPGELVPLSGYLYPDPDGSLWVSTSPMAAPLETNGVQRLKPGDRDHRADTLYAPLEGRELMRFQIPGFVTTVPLSPRELFTFAPPDRFAVGWSGRYQILIHRGDDLVRVERQATPVPVPPEERSDRARRALRPFLAFGGEVGSEAPEVPEVKPFFTRLQLLDDGRLVVIRPLASVATENPDHDPDDPSSPSRTWDAPAAMDLFAPDGTYLGEIQFPVWIRASDPNPVLLGDTILWAVFADDLDVERVGRFRIVP